MQAHDPAVHADPCFPSPPVDARLRHQPPKPSPFPVHAAGVSMSICAVSSTASTAASTSLSSVNRRSSFLAFRVPAPLSRSLAWKLSSSSSSHSPLAPVSAMASSGGGSDTASMKKKLHIFDAEEDLAASLGEYMAELSAKFAAERGAFTVVLSGGSLVKALRKLTEPPYLEAVDWSKWHVFWVDERVVPKDHADSNYKLALDELLSKVPIPTEQVYAINDALSAEGASNDYEARLKQLVRDGVIEISPVTGFPKFDLMLMGMGPDGHVASLFPGKAVAVHKALSKQHDTSDLLPVEMVSLHDGELTWFTDKPAVSMLSSI
ncbi:hypothetical protein PR202_ga21715 [Eleusine coracana subsp. coracana]|uniref:Probable 6-phosphogluconolactonase n=1 Tax=Eleusine coracana subsp. coracana TaxID=191504 RepID=A0AAV5D1P6_ELECO|nr:hypothetical protein PR202_ga21715 [Eleusine coracana subsp. coracana]